MKPTQYIAVVGLLNALTFSLGSDPVAAAAKERPQRGGNADMHMSSKGRDNTNAQWSADPERGWIRTDERHDIKQQKQEAKEHKIRGKQGNERKGKNY